MFELILADRAGLFIVRFFLSTKGIRDGMAETTPSTGYYLALICDTLLSSQGSGAHQSRAFRPVFGATSKFTGVCRGSQIRHSGFLVALRWCFRPCGTGPEVRSSRVDPELYAGHRA